MTDNTGVYEYKPSHVLPIVFAGVMSVSLVTHIYQNFHYRFWRITFFMFWGSLIYITGWILRTISTYNPQNVDLFIAATIFIYAGPPIYSGAAYNLLGRIMHYIPMFAWMNPNRTIYFFIYLGALVEALTAAGAARIGSAPERPDVYRGGATLIAISVVLQCVIEGLLVTIVGVMHYSCSRAGVLPRNLRALFSIPFTAPRPSPVGENCNDVCDAVHHNEWLLFAFDAAPMVLFTFWINLLHPGRYLPRDKKRYLDTDGITERMGPGWLDKRSRLETFVDPLDLSGMVKKEKSHTKYWLEPEQWPACEDGFSTGTASNVAGRSRTHHKQEVVSAHLLSESA